MILNENTFVMLLVEAFFQTFTEKEMVNAKSSTEVIMAISAESREEVEEIVHQAIAAGGSSSNGVMDHCFMYSWSFQDLDGHLWEVMHMSGVEEDTE